MTHTLHRFGSPEDLRDDFVIFAMSAKGINEKGSWKPMRRFMELAFELDPVNAGDMKTGSIYAYTRQEILDAIQDVSIVHAVFSDEAKVTMLLNRVKEADLGISVVVSGLFDRVRAIGEAVGVHQHTVECSGGVWGRTDLLPPSDVMKVTTMCGHGMVAASLVERAARDVRLGRRSIEDAARQLARPCACGVFNPVRAARLVEAIVARQAAEEEGCPVAAGQTTADA
jgi:hypothetical protein